MTTYIYIDNYRGFSKTWIPLSQVNFLVGENSTGKTSFLELIRILCQPDFWILEPKYEIKGLQSKYFYDLVSISSKTKNTFTIGAFWNNKEEELPSAGMLVTYQNQEGRPTPNRVSVIEDGIIRTITGKSLNSIKELNYRARSRTLRVDGNSILNILTEAETIHFSTTGFSKRIVSSEIKVSLLLYRYGDSLFKNGFEKRSNTIPPICTLKSATFAPIRTKPKRTYDEPHISFSPEGKQTPYIIHKRLNDRSKAESFSKFLRKIGCESGLFEQIDIKSYGKSPRSPFEIRIVLGTKALEISNVGYGVSQSLPIIVEMFVRPPETIFMIQQPEVHLHPKAQASIGDLIAEFARTDNKKFIIETHSDFTIDRFRLNLRSYGEIDSQLLFFERTGTGNKVISIKILPNGDLPENQPDNYRAFFFNEALSLLG